MDWMPRQRLSVMGVSHGGAGFDWDMTAFLVLEYLLLSCTVCLDWDRNRRCVVEYFCERVSCNKNNLLRVLLADLFWLFRVDLLRMI